MARNIAFSFLMIAFAACGKVVPDPKTNNPFGGGSFPNKPGQVYGKWTKSDGNATRGLYLNDQDQIGFQRICSPGAGEVQVSTVLQGSVDTFSQVIRVDQGFHQETQNCELTVSKGVMSYRYDGADQLFLNGETTPFTRGTN
jgi:hypothetical protein